MKTINGISPRSLPAVFCALAMVPSVQATVGLTVSPSSITNDYVGKVSLTITGLSAGQTVRVERLTDANGNGVVDAATDGVTRGFTVTDGQLPIIGGVRNLNVPGDDDGLTNGQIRVDLDSPGIDLTDGTASGTFIYRVSDPANGFTAVTKPFTVAQKAYPQGIRGKVTAAAGGAALTGTFVILLNSNGNSIGGCLTDTSGNYAINTLPGSYMVIALPQGYVASGANASVTVVANQFVTNNQAMAAGTFTLAGRITDATSGAGIPGIAMFAQSTNNLFAYSLASDTNGYYSYAVSPSQWRLEAPGSGLAQLGYVQPNKPTVNIINASVTNVNFVSAKATALIYGTVKDGQNNLVNGVDMRADDQSFNLYESDGRSLPTNGVYCLGVPAGAWNVQVQTDTLPSGFTGGSSSNLTLSAGQAAQVNVVLTGATAHLRGKVVNSSGTAQSGLSIQVQPDQGGDGPVVATAGDGSFDFGVSGGNWAIQLNNGNGNPTTLIGPRLTFTVTDGVDINNIVYIVSTVTAQISGVVTNSAGAPVANVNVYAYTDNSNGTNYNQNDTTDSGGHYSMGVINGTWTVGVDCNGLSAAGYGCVNNHSVIINGANGAANFTALPPTPDVISYFLEKEQDFYQTDPTTVIANPGYGPFTVYLGVVQTSPGTVPTANVSFPNGDGRGLPAGNTAQAVQNQDEYPDQATMDSNYPIGNYTFNLFTQDDGNKFPVLNLPAAVYPPTPRISNYAAAQAINPNNPLLVQWDAYAGGTSNDTIWFLVVDANNNRIYSTPTPEGDFAGAMKGTATSTTIPAGTLTPGGVYYGVVIFTKFLSTNTTDYPGAIGKTAASSSTSFPLIQVSPLQVTTTTLPSGTNGNFYSQQLQATGGQTPYTWSLTPGSAALPPNLSLSSGGVLSGTLGASGTYYFYARVTDGNSAVADSGLLSVTIYNQPLAITTASLPNGTVGVAYSAQFAGAGGQTPYSWALAPGSASLPANLTLSSSGSISGTPAGAGTNFFIVRLTDANFVFVNRTLGITNVNAPAKPILSAPTRISSSQFRLSINGTAGQSYTVQDATTLTNAWNTVVVTNAPSSSFPVTDLNATNAIRFYRAFGQ